MSDFEAVIRIKLNSGLPEGRMADEWRQSLAKTIENWFNAAASHSNLFESGFGEVSVNIEDHRPRVY